jgi:3-dehydroquinate synthase
MSKPAASVRPSATKRSTALKAKSRRGEAELLPAQVPPHSRYEVAVETGGRAGAKYHVAIGDGVLAEHVGQLVRASRAQRVLMVVDAGVIKAPAGKAVKLLSKQLTGDGITVSQHLFKPSEAAKSFKSLEAMCAAAAVAKLERRDVVVAIGGGICTDVAGFAAAMYRRGVRFVSCPTTLLSMVDAAVGGKTGVNLVAGSRKELLKNMVGAFWQPLGVVCDVSVLASLPDRILRAGMGECCKHAMLGEQFGQMGDWAAMEECIEECLKHRDDAPSWARLIAMNVQLKARVVGLDEREELAELSGGGRMALNLGHTFAHALETLPGVRPVMTRGKKDVALAGPMQHGEAVTLGLVAALWTSELMGWMPKGSADGYIRERLVPWGLVHRVSKPLPVAKVIERMMSDKKVDGGKLRLILPVEDCGARGQGVPGVKVTSEVPITIVEKVIGSLHQSS